jgi:hypothetical protein
MGRSGACLPPLGEQLRRETLTFGEALDLNRDGIDGLLELSKSVTHLLEVCVWNWWACRSLQPHF